MLNATLQDWTTVRGSGTTSVTQTASDWLDVEEFADAVFWLTVREVTNPASGNVLLFYETSPTADESLFRPMGTTLLTVGGPTILKVMSTGANVPIARYVRWRLAGSTAGTWDATFRVEATFGMGAPGAFSPQKLPGLLLWLRADQGVTLSGSNVTSWSDISGNGNGVSQGTGANQPVFNATGLNGCPAIDFTGSKWLENTVNNLVAANSAYSVLAVAKNGSGALFTIRRTTTYAASMFYTGTTYVHGDGVNGYANVTVSPTTTITQSATTAFKSCHKFVGGLNNPVIYLGGSVQNNTSGGATHQTTETGSTGFQVGTNAASQFWGGLISEIIVCSGAIADADRQNVEAYQLGY